MLDDLLSGQESDFFRFTLAEISTDRHPEEAQDGYLRIARRSPSHWPSRARLGELLVRQGKPEEAVRWLREAVEIRPDIPELQYNLGHACGQIEDWKGADEAYAAVLEVQPESAMALANRAVALHNLGDDAGAGECIDRALALDPENPEFEATRRAIRGGK
ncbi:MAG: tetratricopeptide repeat protein [Planctomycetes bacterium]|nr:tetratricopeptide repeat protein [Planctomycetota bacterium]